MPVKRAPFISLLLIFLILCNPIWSAFTEGAHTTAPSPTPSGIYRRIPTRKYHVQLQVTLSNEVMWLQKAVVILPLPQNNPYQDVKNIQTDSGQILNIPNSSDKYVRYLLTGKNFKQGQEKKLTLQCNVQLYNLIVDFNQIQQIYPYDRTKPEYRRYTGKTGVYIDPAEPRIKSLSRNLWGESKDIIDYAQRCYEYVAKNYRTVKEGTGLHPLAQILDDGGGDCGNLSSIFISLLRRQGIPARHVITVGAEWSMHVWAEFYLERYGWIPVDVNLHKAIGFDYFGRIESRYLGYGNADWIVVSKTTNAQYDFIQTKGNMAILQTYGFCYWRWSLGGKVQSDYAVKATLIQ